MPSCPTPRPNGQKESQARRGGSRRGQERWHPAPGTRPSPFRSRSSPAGTVSLPSHLAKVGKVTAQGLESSPSWGYLHFYYH